MLEEGSPLLKSKIAEFAGEAYPDARELAAIEIGIKKQDLPESCSFDIEQVLKKE